MHGERSADAAVLLLLITRARYQRRRLLRIAKCTNTELIYSDTEPEREIGNSPLAHSRTRHIFRGTYSPIREYLQLQCSGFANDKRYRDPRKFRMQGCTWLIAPGLLPYGGV